MMMLASKRIIVLCFLLSLIILPTLAQESGEPCFPANRVEITAANAAQLTEVARWGRGGVHAAAWSPDNHTLALGSSTGLWLFDSGELTGNAQLFAEHSQTITDLAFSPDSQLVATAALDGLRIWHIENGEQRTLSGQISLHDLTFSADDSILYARRGTRSIMRWQLNPDLSFVELESIAISVSNYAISADNQFMLVDGDALEILSLPDLQTVSTLAMTYEGTIYGMALNPSGDLLAIVIHAPRQDFKGVLLWSLADRAAPLEITQFATDSIPTAVTFTPDGSMLTVGYSSGGIQSWSLFGSGTSLRLMPEYFMEATTQIEQLSYSPDGMVLASVDLDRHILIWDGRTGQTVSAPAGFVDLSLASFSPDGQSVVVVGGDRVYDGQLRVVELATCTITLQVAVDMDGVATAPLFSPDGSMIALGGRRGISIFDAVSGEQRQRLSDITLVTSLDFSPDGSMLAAGSGFGIQVAVWNLPSMEVLQRWNTNQGNLRSLRFSPDSRTLATGDEDGLIRLWNPATAEELATLADHQEAVTALGYNADGRVLASGERGTNVRLWNPATGVVRLGFNSTGFIRTMAFNPAGDLLALAGRESDVEIRDVFSGERLALAIGHTSEINTVSFSPDGTLLVSSGWDGTIRFWGVISNP